MAQKIETWGSRWGFILATAGSAIGLGNLWKFPYVTGMNGGGAFVLIYILCILILGVPLIVTELAIGRAAGSNPVEAFNKLKPKNSFAVEGLGALLLLSGFFLLFGDIFSKGSCIIMMLLGMLLLWRGWGSLGVISGVFIPVLILCYYSVVGGWTIVYMFKAISLELDFCTPAAAKAVMDPLITTADFKHKLIAVSGHLAFSSMCILVLAFGVRNGIERVSKILMPLLFFFLFVLICRSVTLPGAREGIKFFLYPDFSKLTAGAILAAVGLAFFTLSIGIGIITAYGSYLDSSQNLLKSAVLVTVLDTCASLMAGLVIFPAVFAMGFAPTIGPVLLFEIMPSSLNQIPGNLGWLWNLFFFFTVFIAALTSGISLFEPAIACCSGIFKISRVKAIILVTIPVLLVGSFTAISVADWQNLPQLGRTVNFLWPESSNNLFDALDKFSCNWLLPLAGLATTIFAGWAWGSRYAVAEVRKGADNSWDKNIILLIAGLPHDKEMQTIFTPAVVWSIIIRFIAPALLVLAFFDCIGIINLS
jgi:NSS family neurotransmitter:Na+ symporter